VEDVRASLPVTVNSYSEPRTYTMKHGTTSTMTVTNIGAKPAAPAAPPGAITLNWTTPDKRGSSLIMARI